MEPESKIENQISWVYTKQLRETCQFYAEVLGLDVHRETATAVIYRSTPHSFIGICQVFEDRMAEPSGSMITFVTEDVDGWFQRLVDAGAHVDGPPHVLERFGIYTFFVRDPNGYRIEFQKFLAP